MPDVPFSDFGVKWFKDIVGTITDWFTDGLIGGFETVSRHLFNTPLPEGTGTSVIFSPPAPGDTPWHGIYEAVVAGEVLVFALVLLFLAVQGRHFVRIFNVGSAIEDRRAQRRAWTGAVLIVAWYWVGVLTLYFVEGLTIGLVPDVSTVAAALVQLLPTALSNPLLTLLLAATGGFAMVALQAVFFIREILLYIFLYGMPFGIAVAYGNVPVLSRIARRLCRQFIPLAALPLPAAILFRGYELLFVGETAITPETPFLRYLVVVSLPTLTLYLTWKTFRYASPLTARVLGTATRTAAGVGAVAGLGYAAGPQAASTTARWGARAGATQAAADAVFGDDRSDEPQQPPADGQTAHDNIATDDHGGVDAYRRRENDPGYY